jgi:hypothetical protein
MLPPAKTPLKPIFCAERGIVADGLKKPAPVVGMTGFD